MKLTLLTTLALGFSAVSSSAVTTATIRNFLTLTDGLPTLDNTGTPISGSYAVGFFPEGFDFNQEASAVRNGLVQFGSELNTFRFDGLIGTPNSTQDNIPKEGGSQFTGKNIFVMFGDQSTLDSSTLFGVVRLPGQFQDEGQNDQGVALADITPTTAEVQFGVLRAPSAQPNQGQAGPVFNFAQGLELTSGVVIPEPSTGLLAAIAGLALAARRRR